MPRKSKKSVEEAEAAEKKHLLKLHRKRMLRILEAMRCDPTPNCTAAPRSESSDDDDDGLFTWDATIFGPIDSPYEGGVFNLIMKYGPYDLFLPPKVHFITPIFHPNIGPFGKIGLNVLRSQYSLALTIPKLLLSICSLLTDPNPYECYNLEAANLYLADREAYEETVAEWTKKYAMD